MYRGGSWLNYAGSARASYRFSSAPRTATTTLASVSSGKKHNLYKRPEVRSSKRVRRLEYFSYKNRCFLCQTVVFKALGEDKCFQSVCYSWPASRKLELSPEDFPENERHDYDQDGLTESEGDCDDLDPDVEGPSLWYADTDGDGFGDPNSSVESCYDDLLSEGLSYVDNPDDCNDEDAGVYPGRNKSRALSVSSTATEMVLVTLSHPCPMTQAPTATT